MSIPATHHDLLDEPHTVALATVSPRGYPQVTAVWAVRDGDRVLISALSDRQKVKNLRRHPKATVFVIDPTNSFRTLEVRGDVVIEADADYQGFERLLHAYGTDLASYRGLHGDRLLLTLTPTRVLANG